MISRGALIWKSGFIGIGSLLLPATGLAAPAAAAANDCFAIQIVDEQTRRGVPLVSLRTVNKADWWTDSAGFIAFNEPGLMEQEIFFHINSPGYEYPTDMFGNRGVKLKTTRGASAIVPLKRLNIAERLYRVTGQGIYRDSALLGRPVPLKHPLLNGQVLGQDTVIATPYRGKIYWFWGDTDRASYPLGNFGASGATSELPGQGGLDPSQGVDLTYFLDETGFSKPLCRLPGPAAHWIEGPFTVRDANGAERLITRVANHTHLGAAESWDLVMFNDEQAVFEPLRHWDTHQGHESAHPFRARVDGVEYVHLFPNWRVKADLESARDLDRYEAFTCVAGDGKFRGNQTKVDRDAAGRLRYRWQAGADRLDASRMREMIAAGILKREESWIDLHDFETGLPIETGGGSVCWNDFRQHWILLTASTRAGELSFAEADTPVGPWRYARRVVTHGDYNFYNPTQHPFFDQDGGRLIYFEGTYSDFFSNAKTPVPRYDYNQLMYRLALDDPRLDLPVAVYQVRETNGTTRFGLRPQIVSADAWQRIVAIPWCALPPTCHRDHLVPVFASGNPPAALSLSAPAPGATPLFLGLPLNEPEPASTLAGSWNCRASQEGNPDFKFSLRFYLEGENVRAEDPGSGMTGAGTFHDPDLALVLRTRDAAYAVQGRLEKGLLQGTWRQEDGAANGTWSASPADTTPAERHSPALVVLRAYRRVSDGRIEYSAETQPPAGYVDTGQNLCRVWTGPGPLVILDGKIQPGHRPE